MLEQQLVSGLEPARQRSLGYGLRPDSRVDACYLSAGELDSRQQEYAQLLGQLDGFAQLFERLQGGKQSRLLLADRHGAILHSSGCKRFGSKASRLTLEPGACWSEQGMGTNAIGTALIEQADVRVLGQQHFLRANQGISCSASPVFDGQGNLLAVVDISSEEHTHGNDMLFAARLLALCLENTLIAQQQDVCWLLNLATDNIYMQQPWSGLVALNEAGEVLGANRLARHLLPGLQPQQLLEQLQQGQITGWGDTSVLLTRKPQRPAALGSVVPVEEQPADPQLLKLFNAGISLLIQGETGVGKDHLVRQLHAASRRAAGPLIAVNCGALPGELLEAELFGYLPGAFTGSDKKGRLGYVRAAHRGVLFLDEIGELPLSAQTRLLRVLQEKKVTPLGSHQAQEVDFHVLAASNKNLSEMVAQGSFRQDLFYRLNGYQVELQPLRNYPQAEFTRLVTRLLQEWQNHGLCNEALNLLAQQTWPGNIRQLKQVLEVAVILADGQQLRCEHFPTLQSAATAPGNNLLANNIERARRVLDDCNGNVSAAARELGISRTTLYKYLKSC